MGFLRELIAKRPGAEATGQSVMAQVDDEFDPDTWLEDEPVADLADHGVDDFEDADGWTDPEEYDERETPDTDPMDVTADFDDISDEEPETEEPEIAEADDDLPEPEMAKIWEMLNDETDESAEATAEDGMGSAADEVAAIIPDERVEAIADESEEAAGDESAEPTQQELALEALNNLIVNRSNGKAPPKRKGREKTRVLGFGSPEAAGPDVFNRSKEISEKAPGQYPLGWLVVIEGPGQGASFTLQYEVSSIGRGDDQKIRLDFGDNSISRDNHATIAFDKDLLKFFVGHGGKSNLVRLNGRPVLMTEEILDGDLIRMGETTLRFIAFCSAEFAWDLTEGPEDRHDKTG